MTRTQTKMPERAPAKAAGAAGMILSGDFLADRLHAVRSARFDAPCGGYEDRGIAPGLGFGGAAVY
jgi:hypothetical protein